MLIEVLVCFVKQKLIWGLLLFGKLQGAKLWSQSKKTSLLIIIIIPHYKSFIHQHAQTHDKNSNGVCALVLSTHFTVSTGGCCSVGKMYRFLSSCQTAAPLCHHHPFWVCPGELTHFRLQFFPMTSSFPSPHVTINKVCLDDRGFFVCPCWLCTATKIGPTGLSGVTLFDWSTSLAGNLLPESN